MKCAILISLLGLIVASPASTTGKAKPTHAEIESKKCEATKASGVCGLQEMDPTAQCEKARRTNTAYALCNDVNQGDFLSMKKKGGACFNPCDKPQTFCRLSVDSDHTGWVYGQLIRGCCVELD